MAWKFAGQFFSWKQSLKLGDELELWKASGELYITNKIYARRIPDGV